MVNQMLSMSNGFVSKDYGSVNQGGMFDELVGPI
jgi:hypothetical protein